MTGTFCLVVSPITAMHFRNLEFSLHSVTYFYVLCCHLSRKLHETVQAATRYKILFKLI
jgi:fatty acid-binding protein DegV